jgi:hypothetical protein
MSDAASDVAIPCAKIRGGHLVPLDRLPAELRGRWDRAVSKRDHTDARVRQAARDEMAKLADDILTAVGADLLLKAAPRRSFLKIGR